VATHAGRHREAPAEAGDGRSPAVPEEDAMFQDREQIRSALTDYVDGRVGLDALVKRLDAASLRPSDTRHELYLATRPCHYTRAEAVVGRGRHLRRGA
jgi:hypothetical protein